MNNLRKASFALNVKGGGITRQVQTNASLLENLTEVKNRNPRNLELMTIARKPAGYHLEKPGRQFWHTLIVKQTGRHVHAEVHHFKNGPVVKVSTLEWGLKKQLYKTLSVASFTNVGRLIAQRCLESGISSISCNIETSGSARYTALIDEIKKSGLSLEEPPNYIHAKPWDNFRMIKPWTIIE